VTVLPMGVAVGRCVILHGEKNQKMHQTEQKWL